MKAQLLAGALLLSSSARAPFTDRETASRSSSSRCVRQAGFALADGERKALALTIVEPGLKSRLHITLRPVVIPYLPVLPVPCRLRTARRERPEIRARFPQPGAGATRTSDDEGPRHRPPR